MAAPAAPLAIAAHRPPARRTPTTRPPRTYHPPAAHLPPARRRPTDHPPQTYRPPACSPLAEHPVHLRPDP